jgi:hypothetical protein
MWPINATEPDIPPRDCTHGSLCHRRARAEISRAPYCRTGGPLCRIPKTPYPAEKSGYLTPDQKKMVELPGHTMYNIIESAIFAEQVRKLAHLVIH